MKPEEIPPINMPGGNMDQHHTPKRSLQKSDPIEQAAESKTEIIKTPSQDRIRFSKLEATNSQAQEIAKQIRQVHQSMKSMDSHLTKMRESLENIVKIYPPYPPGSRKRIEALRQFSALRNMIDQLATPDLINDVMPPGALIDADDPLDSTAKPHQNDRSSFNIPDISTTASDHQINDTLDKTIAAQSALQVNRQSFVTHANRLISELS